MASEQVVTFQGHHSYIVSIARLCKENGLFTDVTLQCDDGKLLAHRIVLAAVSPFLCRVLGTLGSDSTTIIVPDIRREVVQQLLDFLYTGSMKLSPARTWELQELVLLLQIDPQNVGVEVLEGGDNGYNKMANMSSVCQTLGIKIASKAELPPTKVSPSHTKSPPTHVKSPPTPDRSPPTPLPKLTIKTDSLTTTTSLTNGLSVVTTPRTRIKPLSSRPVYTESPEDGDEGPFNFAPIKVATPGSRPGNSTPGRAGGRGASRTSPRGGRGGPQVSPRSGRGGKGSSYLGDSDVSSPGVPEDTVSSSSVKPVSSIRLVPSSRLRNSRSSTESDQGDSSQYMAVLRPSDNSNVIKIVTNRKRRLSSTAEDSPPPPVNGNGEVRVGAPKETRLDSHGGKGSSRGRGVRTRGRARRGRGGGGVSKGLHDLENTQTWVCAICGQYDPRNDDPGETTEWIGCDCNRWFHKFCTKLRTVDDNFNCRHVHKVCLPSKRVIS